MNCTLGQLGVALNAIAEAAALAHVVGVFDGAMHRLLSHRGCAGETLAPPMRIDGADIFAVLYEVGAAMDAPFRSLAGDRLGAADQSCRSGTFAPDRLPVMSGTPSRPASFRWAI